MDSLSTGISSSEVDLCIFFSTGDQYLRTVETKFKIPAQIVKEIQMLTNVEDVFASLDPYFKEFVLSPLTLTFVRHLRCPPTRNHSFFHSSLLIFIN